jgi:uncharacterized protein (TIGR03435 family)
MPDRRSWHFAVAGFALLTAAVTVSSAQGPGVRESFDTASIRENKSGGYFSARLGPLSFSVTNTTVLELINEYFRIPEKKVVGNLPDWVKSARFDIIARAAGAPLTRSRLVAMIKTLLEDRFRMDMSFEQLTMPAFALVMTRSDGSLGPNLQPSKSVCQLDPLLTPTPEGFGRVPVNPGCGFRHGTSGGWIIGLIANRVTMDQLATDLTGFAGFDRPVVNRTGLSGEFDLMVRPTADMVAPTSEARFLIAMREQLGLTLRAEQLPVDVLRINRIERPSEN